MRISFPGRPIFIQFVPGRRRGSCTRSTRSRSGSRGPPADDGHHKSIWSNFFFKLYRVTHLLADLGWVDLDLECSTGRWAVLQVWCCPTVEHPKSVSTQPGPQGDGSPCNAMISKGIKNTVRGICSDRWAGLRMFLAVPRFGLSCSCGWEFGTIGWAAGQDGGTSNPKSTKLNYSSRCPALYVYRIVSLIEVKLWF